MKVDGKGMGDRGRSGEKRERRGEMREEVGKRREEEEERAESRDGPGISISHGPESPRLLCLLLTCKAYI